LPFIAMSRPLVSAFYAQEDTRTPVKVAILCLLVNVGVGYTLMQHIAHVGLALAVSLSSMLNCLFLAIIMGRRTGLFPLPFVSVMKSVLLSAVIGAGAWYSTRYDILWFALIPVWVAVYGGGSLLLKSDDARMLIGALRRRRG